MSNVHGHEALVGAWQLRSWENRADDGQVTYPMGTDALGSLLYTADGRSPLLLAGTQQVPRLVWERVDPFPGAGYWLAAARGRRPELRQVGEWVG